MRLPILYSMSWPHRVKVNYGRGIDHKFDFVKLGSMSFKVRAKSPKATCDGSNPGSAGPKARIPKDPKPSPKAKPAIKAKLKGAKSRLQG
jgi:hypothetical protein